MTITTNDGTFNAEETATFTSGAEITVASDGGLVFHPATDFAGTESFTFSATYGQLTESATVYLVVVDPEESLSAEQFSMTSAGSLEYATTTETYDTTFTLSQVPFFRRLQNRRVVMGDLCGRLEEATIESTLRIAENYTVTLRTGLMNFTFAAGQELARQNIHVRFNLVDAYQDLQNDIDNLGGPLPARVARWFAGSDFEEGWQYDTLSTVRSVFGAVAYDLDHNTIWYYDDESLEDWGDSPNQSGPADIGIGQKYHSANSTDRDRFGTVIHELTHTCANTDDKGYFNNPAALQNETAAVIWRNPNDANEIITDTITNAQLLDNADSFAGYLAQYYYNW